jgi:hypothetical protein
LVARSAAAGNRISDLLFVLKKKAPALVREVARLSQQEASILGPLQIETSEVALARDIPACTDPAELAALVKEALAVGCVNQLPRLLKPKDPSLLQQAAQLAGPDEKPVQRQDMGNTLMPGHRWQSLRQSGTERNAVESERHREHPKRVRATCVVEGDAVHGVVSAVRHQSQDGLQVPQAVQADRH